MDNSEVLLERAIRSLEEANISENLWAVGGGTVLSSVYGHRLSKDIDIFISEPQLLGGISPRFNPVTEEALDYEETNSFVSLTFPEGKIDFVNASQISGFRPEKKNFLGSVVYVEDPVEIVSKKLFFRGQYVLPRDLFDLAVVYDSDRKEDLFGVLVNIKDKMAAFKKSFHTVIHSKDFVPYTVSNKDMLLETNRIAGGQEIELCKAFLNELDTRVLKGNQNEP